jgi:hypothetical protein
MSSPPAGDPLAHKPENFVAFTVTHHRTKKCPVQRVETFTVADVPHSSPPRASVGTFASVKELTTPATAVADAADAESVAADAQ